jgi:O-antigen ligase
MRKITFWLSLLMIFIIPWEDTLSISAIGSLSRLIGLVVAGFWLLTILTEGRARKPHPFHVLVLLFFLWNALSYFWSQDIPGTVERIITYAQIFLMLLIVWELYKKPTDLIAGLQAYVLGSYVCIASSIINYLEGRVAVSFEVRYSATGINAVDLSLLLLLGIPLAWHLFLQLDKKKYRILRFIDIVYLPLAVFAILLTGSRTSLFAIVPAIIFIFWPNRLDIGRYILISIFLAVSLLIVRSVLPAAIIERLSTASSSIASADIGGRVKIWGDALAIFLGHPLIGSGGGTLYTVIGSAAHETFLSILAETGLIGLLLFICILAIVLNQAARLLKGYSGLWFSVFFIWAIGVLSLSWEVKKVTWLILIFVIIEGVAMQEQYRSEILKSTVSETEKGQSLTPSVEPRE